MSEERLELRYIPLTQAERWDANTKLHDINRPPDRPASHRGCWPVHREDFKMSIWRLKGDSVSQVGLAEPLAPVIPLAAAVWAKHGAAELVVTSGNDGRHSRTSLHYAGHALDFRTKNLPTDDAKRAAAAQTPKGLS